MNDNIIQSDKQTVIEFLNQPNVRFTQSKYVREFEKAWSEWLGVKHTVYVNSGASANYIMASIVRELYGSKKEVIVPPIGWVSDVASYIKNDLTPVFVDVGLDNLSMTVENIEKAITDKTVAINLVHALGFNALNDRLLEVAKKYNLMLIEDCCESHGATFNKQKIGTFGKMSNFSFYFGHHITTVEGGVVCTNDDMIYDLAKLFRSHGMTRETSKEMQDKYKNKYPNLNPLFTFAVPGYNMRNVEINAVIGLEQLKRLDSNIEKRVENFSTWIEALDDEFFYTDYEVEGNSNFALPLILRSPSLQSLNSVCETLESNGIEYRLGTAGGGNQALQPYLREGKYDYRIDGDLTNANHIHEFGLYVGNHTDLSKEQIINLCNELNKVKNV
jgi:CDP-6-deoxy-D-xylo-4-hexulose-3-dehydrase